MAFEEFIDVLEKNGIETLVQPEDLACFAYDASYLESVPKAVIFPKRTQEVSKILLAANEHRIPVTPRGAGTCLSGGAVPAPNGVSLCLTRMNKIVEIDEENLTAIVQPGVITRELQQEVERKGLFYPPDPGSVKISTIGGNVAENAGGPFCFKYGVTKDYVLGLEVVLPTGKIVRFGGKAVKNVSGLNLSSLFLGSEGILGVITEVTVKLIPQPETKRTILAVFDDLDAAAQTVSDIVAKKIVPATLELMDQDTMHLIEQVVPANLPISAAASLLIDVDGSESEVLKQQKTVENICLNNRAREVRVAKTLQESERLWEGRRSAFGALALACKAVVVEDVSVPRSKLPEVIRKIKEIGERYGIVIPVLGHTGDGNLHPQLLLQELSREEWERVEKAADAIFAVALDLGGTLSGEHGIGLLKKKYMSWQFSPETLELMQTLKNTLDPNNILNPHILL